MSPPSREPGSLPNNDRCDQPGPTGATGPADDTILLYRCVSIYDRFKPLGPMEHAGRSRRYWRPVGLSAILRRSPEFHGSGVKGRAREWARRRAAASGRKDWPPPVLGDLAVVYWHDVDGFKVDSSTGRRHPKECSLVSSMVRLVRRHQLPSAPVRRVESRRANSYSSSRSV